MIPLKKGESDHNVLLGSPLPPAYGAQVEQIQEGGAAEAGLNETIESILDEKARPSDPKFVDGQELSFVAKIRQQVPRSYYFVTQLILPLLAMIGWCFLFGWALARLEMKEEIESNDAVLREMFRSYADHTTERNQIWAAMQNTSVHCTSDAVMQEVLQAIPNLNETVARVETCSLMEGKERFPYDDFFPFVLREDPQLSFNWMNCYGPVEDMGSLEYAFPFFGLNPKRNRDEQHLRYLLRFSDNVNKAFQEDYPDVVELEGITLAYNKPLPQSDILFRYVNNATGSEGCQVHVAGGALFWFTIMTTIGYGNTAPVTGSGRTLVFTCGFINILGFLILNNLSGQVWKHVFEDVFLRYNMQYLVKGPVSMLFWLCMTSFWVLVIAVCVMVGRRKRSDEEFPLSDAYWFSYITTTTVGLGDIHIAHDEIQSSDMFFIPLLILIGFNFLGIFMEKGADLHKRVIQDVSGLRDVLKGRRAQARAAGSDEQLQ